MPELLEPRQPAAPRRAKLVTALALQTGQTNTAERKRRDHLNPLIDNPRGQQTAGQA